MYNIYKYNTFKEEFGMIKLVVGKKGSGKTKTMLDAIAKAVETESGNVIFVCNSDRHMLEVTHSARLAIPALPGAQ